MTNECDGKSLIVLCGHDNRWCHSDQTFHVPFVLSSADETKTTGILKIRTSLEERTDSSEKTEAIVGFPDFSCKVPD